jgi:hypothetical protein
LTGPHVTRVVIALLEAQSGAPTIRQHEDPTFENAFWGQIT